LIEEGITAKTNTKKSKYWLQKNTGFSAISIGWYEI